MPFPALSLMFNVPDAVPDVVGEKLTLIVHVPDGANELPQVVLSMPNTPLLVPMPLIATVPPRLVLGLVTVTVLSALVVPSGTMPNESDPGESVNAESVPVPLRAIIPGAAGGCGALLALLVMFTLPVRVPCAVGVKVTPTVQLEPADPVGARMVEPVRLQGFVPTGVVPKSPDVVMV